ncbi:hypothetical protein EDD22DRAFT_996781 [Suillus occidentalis]|nr:hypothetical protein EDD22DRAFT_996781 [Suillus occidentalis]
MSPSTISLNVPILQSYTPRFGIEYFGMDTRLIVPLNSLGLLLFCVVHCTWATSNAYSSPSVVLSSIGSDESKNLIDGSESIPLAEAERGRGCSCHELSFQAIVQNPAQAATLQNDTLNLRNAYYVIDAFGTLTIGTRVETIFMGGTACSDYLIQIGLHLSSARWKLSDAVVQKCNSVFWQIFMLDTWISFYAGRPPNVSPDWIDAPYPNDDFAVVNNKGEKEMSGTRSPLLYLTVFKSP